MHKIGKKGLRLYKSAGARRSAVTQLRKFGYNYFVGFRDIDKIHPAGLSYGISEVYPLNPYYRDIYYEGQHIIH